jgi:hypothetical protein
MLHIGLDMHKRFARVEVMESDGEVVDKRVLLQYDRVGVARKEFLPSGKICIIHPRFTRRVK